MDDMFDGTCDICGEGESVDNPLADFVPEGITPETFTEESRILAHGECGFGSGYVMA
jgi:hypothetical protein